MKKRLSVKRQDAEMRRKRASGPEGSLDRGGNARRVRLKDVARRLGEGVLSTSVDLMLWNIAFWGTVSLPQSTSGQVWRAQVEADRFLREVNYDVIKQAINNAKRHGWIKKSRRHAAPEITASGKRRLSSMLPMYDEKRVWDGRIHLVTYDIPETQHDDRDLLREQLKRVGCAMLQESVWVTPYNPIDTLRTYIEERNLAGTVLVSDMGQGGSIGEEDLRALLVRVYRLEECNARYGQWLEEAREERIDHWMAIKYLSILSDDPQLPFALLPPWWKGEKVYARVKHSLPQT